jgi:predicted N-acyltransferase
VSTPARYQVRFIHSIAEVDALQWNTLVGTNYPFLQHEFLLALETSGCTSRKTGWQVLHALVEMADVENTEIANTEVAHADLLACMPLYAKTNSMGEYVFDWAWADAYQRHGLSYYPKLVCAIPFTPCAGPRICVAGSVNAEQMHGILLAAVRELAGRMQASSWHILFPEPELRQSLTRLGLLQRTGCQYQWFNAGYLGFEDFLATFSSRKRKNLRKERERVREQGIEFVVLEGADITDDHWQDFYQFYQSTYLVRGRAPYLNQKFFTELGRTMPQYLMLVMARKDGNNIAGALFFKGIDTLYGRYWGCTEEYQFLHFETCYYQGIDYCIRHNIQRMDSGAQGEHKIQRGFKPVHTWSSHWIQHPGFASAIETFLQDEQQHIEAYVERASDYLPFRKDLELGAK